MGLVLPEPGTTPGPTWASEIVDAFESVDAHDHTTGKGTKVPSAGLNLNADVELNDNRLTEVRSVKFETTTGSLAGAAHARSLHWSGSSLIATTESGVEVAIITGGQMNPSAAGGIGGDYSGSAAQWRYEAVNLTFVGYRDFPNLAHASLRTGPVKIVSESAGATNGVTLRVPTDISTSYNLRLPKVASSGTDVLTVTTAGVITGSKSLSVTRLDATIVSASNEIFAERVTITEADVRHADRTLMMSPTTANAPSTTDWASSVNANAPVWNHTTAVHGEQLFVPLDVTVGDEITSVSVYVQQGSTTPLLSASLRTHDALTGTTTIHGTVVTAANTDRQKLTLTGSALTIGTDDFAFVMIETRAELTLKRYFGAELKYRRP